MKHDWEYKKLGEVAEIIGGSTPKTNIKEYWDGDYFWITPAELKGDRFIKSTSRTITDLAVENTNLSLLPKGTVLLSSRAPIGKVAIADVPMYCNQGFKNIICGEKLNNNYVYWLLYGKTEYLNSLGVGATFKEISKKIVENIPIPLPPLSTQQSIVSELDSLSKIIADCKETLKDYDALEQSIFYDMFGDPVKNEKGWEVKKLGEIANVKVGPFGSLLHKEDYILGGIPLINPIHMRDFQIVPSNEFTVSIEKVNELTDYILKENDVILARRGDIGRCAIVSKNEDGFLCGTGSLFVRFKNSMSSVFTMYIIKSDSFVKYLQSCSKGATMQNLNSTTISNLNIILPPLPLQQSFATKIEAIEQMKAETREALQEAETLFQARMDYWFG